LRDEADEFETNFITQDRTLCCGCNKKSLGTPFERHGLTEIGPHNEELRAGILVGKALFIGRAAEMLAPETNSSTEAPMAFPLQEIRANRDYFVHKLQAEKQRNDVLKAVEGGKFDFVLLDTRGREPFANGHIPGAWCAPEEEIEKLAPLLPTDRELVTYCWGHD